MSENNLSQNDNDLNFQTQQNDSKIDSLMNRFNNQCEIKYSPYFSQNIVQGQVIIPFDTELQQQNNSKVELLSECNQDEKFNFFRSTLCLWIFWEAIILIVLIYNLSSFSLSSNYMTNFFGFGIMFIGLLLVIMLKNRNEKKLAFLNIVQSQQVDKTLFFIITIIQGFFDLYVVGFIVLILAGNEDDDNQNSRRMFAKTIYIGMLMHFLLLVSISLASIITLIQQKIDPKQYFIISSIVSLFFGIMYQAAALKFEIIPTLVIFVFISIFGTAIVISGQQITNGKFSLNKNQKHMAAILQYLNLFCLWF